MRVRSLGYVALEVDAPDAFGRFASDVLGVEAQSDAQVARLRIDARAWRVEARQGPRNDIVAAGFEVADGVEFEAFARHLRERGLEAQQDDALARERGVQCLLRTQDPAGMQVELFFGAREQNHRAPALPGHAGFVTGGQGLGHIALSTPDLDASERFYREALGFRLSDYIPLTIPGLGTFDLRFMHCNARHHTLALMGAPMPKRLLHFMFECRELDDVGRAYDRAQAHDAVSATLGRHTNDDMLSFYAVMPGGIEVEIGWGGLKLDEPTWSVVRHEKTSRWGHVRKRRPNPPADEPVNQREKT